MKDDVFLDEVKLPEAIENRKCTVLIGFVQIPQQANELMRQLFELLPLQSLDLGHLKRMRKIDGELWALLGPREAYESAIESGLTPFEVTRTIEVLASAPRSTEDYEAASWPVARVLRPRPSSPTIAQVRSLAQRFREVLSSKSEGNCANGAAILWDPNCQEVLVELNSSSKRALLKHAPMICIEQNAQHQQRHTKSNQYLCTGLDLILSHEPCIMCSMALVHARIRRVIYANPDAALGGLGSTAYIHALRSINHRYRVWRFSSSQ